MYICKLSLSVVFFWGGVYMWYSGVYFGLRVWGYKKVRKKDCEIFGKDKKKVLLCTRF